MATYKTRNDLRYFNEKTIKIDDRIFVADPTVDECAYQYGRVIAMYENYNGNEFVEIETDNGECFKLYPDDIRLVQPDEFKAANEHY